MATITGSITYQNQTVSAAVADYLVELLKNGALDQQQTLTTAQASVTFTVTAGTYQARVTARDATGSALAAAVLSNSVTVVVVTGQVPLTVSIVAG